MVYSVNLTARAVRNLRAIYVTINAENSESAAKWFYGLEEAIFSLEHSPQRGPVIREHSALRHLLYGNKPHIYRIIYSIDVSTKTVNIIHIRHRARDEFRTP